MKTLSIMLERNRGIKDTQYPWLAWGREMLMQHHRYAHKYKGITFRQHTYTGKIQMALA